jgi:hypothetical protein
MAGHVHHLEERSPARGRRGENAVAQAVAGKMRRDRATFGIGLAISATLRARSWPHLLTLRNTGPSMMPPTASQSRTAATGQAIDPRQTATTAPPPSWSVLDRRILTRRPCGHSSISATRDELVRVGYLARGEIPPVALPSRDGRRFAVNTGVSRTPGDPPVATARLWSR